MIAHPPHRVGRTVELRFDTGDGPATATFEVPPDVETDDTADAAVAAGWLPAMARREPLTVTAPVSPRLCRGAERIADVLLTWDRALHPGAGWYGRVALEAQPGDPGPAPPAGDGRRVACFFSGGVDSFHTVLRRWEEIDELVFVHGFDLADQRDETLNRHVSQRLYDAAEHLGLRLVELQCDLVAFGNAAGVGWDDYHGAAMAAVAHLLAPRYSKLYVPATTTYDQLYPLGSHPLLDPLWSSERVELVHDGADATRVEKLRLIAEHPAALRHLRVCFENRDGAYNCGVCEKCVRTAVGIRIAGVEGRFETLPSPSLRQIAAVDIHGLGNTWRSYLDELEHAGANPRLQWAIRAALARHDLRARPLIGRWVR